MLEQLREKGKSATNTPAQTRVPFLGKIPPKQHRMQGLHQSLMLEDSPDPPTGSGTAGDTTTARIIPPTQGGEGNGDAQQDALADAASTAADEETAHDSAGSTADAGLSAPPDPKDGRLGHGVWKPPAYADMENYEQALLVYAQDTAESGAPPPKWNEWQSAAVEICRECFPEVWE